MAVVRIPQGGKQPDDPIEAAKRRIFLIGTPAGILTILAFWGIGMKQNTESVSNIFALPFLAIFFLVLVSLLWRCLISLHVFELILYALVMAYTLWEFASIMISAVLTGESFSPDLTLWLPFIYILSFLVLNTKKALLLSVVFLLVTLMIGLITGLFFLSRGMAFPNPLLLVQFYFASGFYIAVLYLIAQIKERFISEQVVARNMSKLAMTDSLTQVDNRRLLTQYLRDEVHRSERHNLPLSVILFDLDRFKKINDSFGHNAGDTVLQETAQLLRQYLRTTDVFGRWGGDEFLCLAIHSDVIKAVELAERMRDILQRSHFRGGIKVTASFGVTDFQKGDSPEIMIRRADLGLYKAKAGGRNRVEPVIAGVTLPIFEGEKPGPGSVEQETDLRIPGS